MKKLKSLLQSKIFLTFLFLCFLGRFVLVLSIPRHSNYTLEDTKFLGIVQDYILKEDQYQVKIAVGNEVLSGFTTQNMRDLDIGLHDTVLIEGSLKELSRGTNFHDFNYQEYAKRHRQYYSIDIEKISIVEKNSNLFYQIKDFFRKKVDTFSTSSYLYAFLLGDTSFINGRVMESYRNNGVSHLLAVSGMHVSFLMGFFAFLFKKVRLADHIQILFFCIFLSFYSFLVGFSPSVLRASLFFILLQLNRMFKWDIKPIFLLIFIFFGLVFLNPFYLWDVGFQYSFAISFVLVFSSHFFTKKKNYFLSLLATSYTSFLASIVIGVFHFHQIQLFSIFYNLLFVPLVSFLIFPFSFLVFICLPLEKIYQFLIFILENLSLFFNQWTFSLWIMRHPNWLGLIFLFLISFGTLFLFVQHRKAHLLVLFIGLWFYHHINFFLSDEYMTMLDVGQGDCTLLVSNHQVMLVDTGGSIYKDIAQSIIIPYLKAQGILKIDFLVLTHGDYDHLGSTLSLLENFSVQRVLFNANDLNQNEQQIVSYLEKQNIVYLKTSLQQSFTIGNFLISSFSLDTLDENDSSIILQGKNDNFSFLLMGDASLLSEDEWMRVYSKSSVDILKVGHHGSKTSTGSSFLNFVNPKIALISAGRNNRFGHPNQEVINRLEERSVSIYSTFENGAITIDFQKNGNIFTKIP